MKLKDWLGLSTQEKARAADNFYMKLWLWLFVSILIALTSHSVFLHLFLWTLVYYLLVKALWH
tara:strand:+ start:444 stop:632 length:189 start_codon:yes stop_codon:yes gene_type:complete